MSFFNLLVSLVVSSIAPQYQQWIDVQQTDSQINRVWIQPRFDKGPSYFKFIYRTIQLPLDDQKPFHDFLGWIDCTNDDYLIEISGITYQGETTYSEKLSPSVPFHGEPDQDVIGKVIELTCGN